MQKQSRLSGMLITQLFYFFELSLRINIKLLLRRTIVLHRERHQSNEN